MLHVTVTDNRKCCCPSALTVLFPISEPPIILASEASALSSHLCHMSAANVYAHERQNVQYFLSGCLIFGIFTGVALILLLLLRCTDCTQK